MRKYRVVQGFVVLPVRLDPDGSNPVFTKMQINFFHSQHSRRPNQTKTRALPVTPPYRNDEGQIRQKPEHIPVHHRIEIMIWSAENEKSLSSKRK